MTRVRLTSEAAARFPDLANRTGTVLASQATILSKQTTVIAANGTPPGIWHRVIWEGIGYAWVPVADIEPTPDPEPPA